jgi:hypothetical protein
MSWRCDVKCGEVPRLMMDPCSYSLAVENDEATTGGIGRTVVKVPRFWSEWATGDRLLHAKLWKTSRIQLF